ncbi:hypothetical protein AB0O95_11230 [Rhodoglobus sp. NPDC076762]
MTLRSLAKLGLVVVVGVLLAACTTAPAGFHRTQAREAISDLVATVGTERHDDIDGVARSAVAVIDSMVGDSLTLVGIFATEPQNDEEPFGVLIFRVQYSPVQVGKNYIDAFDACYEAEFNRFGATDYWVLHAENEPTEVRCPENPVAVTPLADASPVSVVASNAEEAAVEVLMELDDQALNDADLIGQRIQARLDAPSGPLEELALPSVVITERGVGVALGTTPRECVLVSLIDGEAVRVRPAPILLEKGELGCRAETAIADPARLGYPH